MPMCRQVFMQSTHGQALTRGNWHAPVCTDCHGIHTIKAPSDPKSAVASGNVGNTCGSCHESVKLSNEFGVEGNRVSSYLSSYHGMASRVGSATVANCASCHGVHNILPSSDPRSTINHANLAKTCGQCHPGANEKFIASKVHLDATNKADVGTKVIGLISKFYIWMIVAVIGGMVLHNLLVFRKKLALHRIGHPADPVPHDIGAARAAPDVADQLLHPGADWIRVALSFVMAGDRLHQRTRAQPDSPHRRSRADRGQHVPSSGMSAAIPTAVSSSRTCCPIGRMSPMFAMPCCTTSGLSEQRPMFRRFSYAEKAEYWALVWGMFVMAATGLMAWFKGFVGQRVPGWWVDAAITIHWYEAILATLAIVVWHIYAVIFDPDAYPMNWAWFDGKMSIEHYEHEHPLDTLAIEKANWL